MKKILKIISIIISIFIVYVTIKIFSMNLYVSLNNEEREILEYRLGFQDLTLAENIHSSSFDFFGECLFTKFNIKQENFNLFKARNSIILNEVRYNEVHIEIFNQPPFYILWWDPQKINRDIYGFEKKEDLYYEYILLGKQDSQSDRIIFYIYLCGS